MTARTLAFIDHLPESLKFGENGLSAQCVRLKTILLDEIMQRASQGCDTFYCQAARGMGIIFGHQVLLVKALAYPEIKLICVVPDEARTRAWPENWQDRRFRLLKQSDDMVLISNGHTCGCDRRLNRYMVDRADVLLTLCDESCCDDTAYAVAYARGRDREIVRIDPRTLDRTAGEPPK